MMDYCYLFTQLVALLEKKIEFSSLNWFGNLAPDEEDVSSGVVLVCNPFCSQPHFHFLFVNSVSSQDKRDTMMQRGAT